VWVCSFPLTPWGYATYNFSPPPKNKARIWNHWIRGLNSGLSLSAPQVGAQSFRGAFPSSYNVRRGLKCLWGSFQFS
jgi:hypothetical protein